MPARPTLLFLHANGYLPGCYRQLLDGLRTHYELTAPELLPSESCSAGGVADWSDLSGDVIREIEAQRPARAWFGVGHSMGALVLLHVASRQPARFSQLVLLDPPVLSRALLLALRWMPKTWRSRGVMAQKAARRPERWSDADSAFRDLRARRALQRVSDSVIWDYVHTCTLRQGDDLVLRFPKAWEVELHSCPPDTWAALAGPLPPITVVRGSLSQILTPHHIEEWRHRRPQDRHITLDDVGHLCPLEDPDATARAVLASCAASQVERKSNQER